MSRAVRARLRHAPISLYVNDIFAFGRDGRRGSGAFADSLLVSAVGDRRAFDMFNGKIAAHLRAGMLTACDRIRRSRGRVDDRSRREADQS